jgi:hypothetical protein
VYITSLNIKNSPCLFSINQPICVKNVFNVNRVLNFKKMIN